MLLLVGAALAEEEDRFALTYDVEMVDEAWRAAAERREQRVRATGRAMFWTGLGVTAASVLGLVATDDPAVSSACFLGLGVGVSWTGSGVALTSTVGPPRE